MANCRHRSGALANSRTFKTRWPVWWTSIFFWPRHYTLLIKAKKRVLWHTVTSGNIVGNATWISIRRTTNIGFPPFGDCFRALDSNDRSVVISDCGSRWAHYTITDLASLDRVSCLSTRTGEGSQWPLEYHGFNGLLPYIPGPSYEFWMYYLRLKSKTQ